MDSTHSGGTPSLNMPVLSKSPPHQPASSNPNPALQDTQDSFPTQPEFNLVLPPPEPTENHIDEERILFKPHLIEEPTPNPLVSAKTWGELHQAVRNFRTRYAHLCTKVPSCFTFRPVHDSGTLLKTRLYFVNTPTSGREQTILYCDIPASAPEQEKPDENAERTQAASTSFHLLPLFPFIDTSFQLLPYLGKMSKEEKLQMERKRQVSWGINQYENHPSGEIVFSAIGTLFVTHDDGIAVKSHFPTAIELEAQNGSGGCVNPQICPLNPDLIAFCLNGDIWLYNMTARQEHRLTYSRKETKSLADNPKTSGFPSYIIQEEFHRYIGFWWQPVSRDGVYRILYEEIDESEVEIIHFPLGDNEDYSVEETRFPRAGTPNAKSTLKLLEFQLDASKRIAWVHTLDLRMPLNDHFPWLEYVVRVGWLSNGKCVWTQILDRSQRHLELVLIPLECFVSPFGSSSKSSTHVEKANEPNHGTGLVDASTPISLSPTSSSNDQTQSEASGILTNHTGSEWPQHPFGQSDHAASPSKSVIKAETLWPRAVCVLLQERSDYWINVHDILHFFHSEPYDGTLSLIWASEETGFRHLYHITLQQPSVAEAQSNETLFSSISSYDPPPQFKIIRTIQLTTGEWEVIDKNLWVDETRHLVFFMGLADNALEKHLYVVSLHEPGLIRRITALGFSHAVSLDPVCNMFVTVYSSISSLPACEVFRIAASDTSSSYPSVDSLVFTSLGYLVEPTEPNPSYNHPKIYSHEIESGDTLYAMLLTPPNLQPGHRYPTVLSIYGGPEVQLVNNAFKGMRMLRLHLLASLGYVVVVIDSRGSRFRGVKFEAHIKDRMGTIEIGDQVEMLQRIAATANCIDLSRVAIHGWSYGGYLSLMGLAQRPDVFKVAIAGAPVTSWSLYDTAYTERYMGLPIDNPKGYLKGSVLSYVMNFPDDANRLLIIHGLIDENVHFSHTAGLIKALIRAGKPYQLQVYPNERHSLRHLDSSEHYETAVLSFLQSYL